MSLVDAVSRFAPLRLPNGQQAFVLQVQDGALVGKEKPEDIARAGLRAVTRGIDELDTDRMAVEVRAALALDPKGLEKRMARMLNVPVIRTGR